MTSPQTNAVISDINANSPGITASLVTGVFTSIFPGYDVLLTTTAGSLPPYGTTYLGIDFTATADSDPSTQGFTVAAIAAVPEPLTGLTAAFPGICFLLSRRRGRVGHRMRDE